MSKIRVERLIIFPGPVNNINSHLSTMQIGIYFTNRYKDVFSYFRTLGLKSEACMPLRSLGPVKFLGKPLYFLPTHLIEVQEILGTIEYQVTFMYQEVDYTLQAVN